MAHQHPPRFLKIVDDAKTRVRETNVDAVKAKIDRGDKFLLVDVREESEYAKDHLPSAIRLGKGIIERDIEARVPRIEYRVSAVLRWRFPLRSGRGQPAKDGIHERDFDGRRHSRLAREGISAGEMRRWAAGVGSQSRRNLSAA